MAGKRHEGGVSYHVPEKDYFEKRELRRHAGVFALWALGVGAVISGDFSGWNLGFAVGGWGGMFIATIIISIMYLGLTYSIAEMSPALPHTGGAYSFARTAFGPWGGFITGIAENIEYVLTPAVIMFFIGSYLTAIFETPGPGHWDLDRSHFPGGTTPITQWLMTESMPGIWRMLPDDGEPGRLITSTSEVIVRVSLASSILFVTA